jgi:hypothetical protein
MVEWVGTWMGRRLAGPGIGGHRLMLVRAAAAGSDCGTGMIVVGYIDHDGDRDDRQTGGDSSSPHAHAHRHYAGPSGPGDCSLERTRIVAGDTQSGAHSAVHKSRVCTLEALGVALVARLAGTAAFASLSLCERRGVKDCPSLWGCDG